MGRIILIVLAFSFITACNKDKLETKPSIKIKSVSSTTIAQGQPLQVEMEFADKEGDINDSIFMFKTRLNKRVRPTIRDMVPISIPDARNAKRGTIQLFLEYNNYLISALDPGPPPNAEPDTLSVRFALRDKAGNVSDTVSIGTIIVARQ